IWAPATLDPTPANMSGWGIGSFQYNGTEAAQRYGAGAKGAYLTAQAMPYKATESEGKIVAGFLSSTQPAIWWGFKVYFVTSAADSATTPTCYARFTRDEAGAAPGKPVAGMVRAFDPEAMRNGNRLAFYTWDNGLGWSYFRNLKVSAL
ncbi:MAG TPA: hypothetical protein PLZ36_16285, partial [Armatimonadota bacterium]|nr:hypothetical protein [Armatimonadota bacterium]